MPNAHTWETREACGHPDGTLPHALAGDRPVWPRDRVADFQHMTLEVTLDVPAKSLRGVATHRLSPLNDGLRFVELDGIELAIESVTVDGRAAKHQYDGPRFL